MPITWTVFHPAQLLVAAGTGEITATDVLSYLDDTNRAGATSYRKLFDLTGVVSMLPAEDVRLIGMRVAALAGHKPTGPLAIVVESDTIEELAKLFEVTAQTKRPMQFFRDARTARAWLDEIAPVPSSNAPPD
jgi:hypothetical protein